jgi:hypothetical protein
MFSWLTIGLCIFFGYFRYNLVTPALAVIPALAELFYNRRHFFEMWLMRSRRHGAYIIFIQIIGVIFMGYVFYGVGRLARLFFA